MPTAPEADFGESSWWTINTGQDPAKLSPGEALLIRNLQCDFSDLVTRPGFRGKFATPLSNPFYVLAAFRTASTTQVIGTSGGKLYRCTPGGSPVGTNYTYADITPATVTVASSAACAVRFGKYLYIADGTNALMRITDSGSGATVVGLIAPPTAPRASLTSTSIDPFNNASQWNGVAPLIYPGGALLANPSFELGTPVGGGNLYPLTNWADVSVSGLGTHYESRVANGVQTPQFGTNALLLDKPGYATQQVVSGLPSRDLSAYGIANQIVRVYTFAGFFHNADTSNTATIPVTIEAFDSGGVLLGTATSSMETPYSSVVTNYLPVKFSCSFADVSTEPDHFHVTLAAGPSNIAGDNSMYIDEVSLIGVDVGFNITNATGTNPLLVSLSNASEIITDPNSFQYTENLWVAKTYSSAIDLSKSNILSVGISIPSTSLNAENVNPAFRFGFKTAAGSTITWSNTCTYSDDSTEIFCDCSTVDVAIRSATKIFYIQLLDNLPNVNPADVFSFGPLTASGNLSVGFAPYLYNFEEIDYVAANDLVQSSGSPLTIAITPTGPTAEASLIFTDASGTPIYFNNATANRLKVFRFGGTPDAGSGLLYGRAIALFDPTADAVDPSGNGYWKWTAATKTFTDNTPDSAILLSTDFYQEGRSNFPVGIQRLAVNQGRLIGTKGDGAYGSWEINAESNGTVYYGERGLYYSDTLLTTDPWASIKGWFNRLTSSSADPDNVVSAIAFGSTVALLREQVVTINHNGNPLQLAFTDFLRDAGAGCVAPKAACVVGNAIWYLSRGGVLQFAQNNIDPVSIRINSLIAPTGNDGGPVITPASAALSFATYSDLRFYLGAPLPGSTVCDAIYMWDVRAQNPTPNGGGWFQFTPPVPMTSAVSLASGEDDDSCIWGGMDGQLYFHEGQYDQATPTASHAAIPFLLQSRLYGQSPGLQWYSTNIPNDLHFDVYSLANMTLSLAVVGDIAAAAWSLNYSVMATTLTRPYTWVANNAAGKTLQVVMSGAVTSQFRLRNYFLRTAEGTTR